jgi:hypothetical protein
MKLALLAAAAVLAVAALPSTAHAEESDLDGYGPIFAAAGALYVVPTATFLVIDIKDLATGHERSVPYGLTETSFNGVAAALFFYTAAHEYPDGARTDELLLGGMHAALAVHGIYTIVQSVRHEPAAPMLRVGSARANVTLAPISDGKTTHTGLAMVGTF